MRLPPSHLVCVHGTCLLVPEYSSHMGIAVRQLLAKRWPWSHFTKFIFSNLCWNSLYIVLCYQNKISTNQKYELCCFEPIYHRLDQVFYHNCVMWLLMNIINIILKHTESLTGFVIWLKMLVGSDDIQHTEWSIESNWEIKNLKNKILLCMYVIFGIWGEQFYQANNGMKSN